MNEDNKTIDTEEYLKKRIEELNFRDEKRANIERKMREENDILRKENEVLRKKNSTLKNEIIKIVNILGE